MKKLRLTEERLRQGMIKERISLLRGEICPRLLCALKEHFPESYESALLLEVLPEQGETIYTLLLAGESIIEVEIARGSEGRTLVRKTSLEEWKLEESPLDRTLRRTLEMALTLQSSDPDGHE